MKFKQIFWVIVVLIFIFGGIFLSNKSTDSIKVGIITALSDDLASLGDEARNSTMLAINEINEGGGINGKPIEVFVEDGKCSGKDAVSAINKLINLDDVSVIFGGTCSSETMAITPITEKNKIILFTSWALAPKVTYDNDFVFRNAPSDVGGANILAELAYKNGVRKIGIITESTDYNIGFEEVFSKKFIELGGQISTSENFLSDNRDLKSVVLKNLLSPTDAILVNANGPNAGVVSKLIRDLDNKKSLYGSIFFADKNVLDNFGQYMEGGYTSEPANLDENNPRVQAFISAYEKEYNIKPQYLFWAAASYDAVNIYFEALHSVGQNSDDIKKYLHNKVDFEGVLGKYGFDENGDVVGIKFDKKQIINSQLKIIE